MCHTHWPGDGIDLIRADANAGTLLVRLAENDCHYVIPAHELARLLGWAAPEWKAEPEPVISADLSEYEGCHIARAPHYHHFEHLHRFEAVQVHFTHYGRSRSRTATATCRSP